MADDIPPARRRRRAAGVRATTLRPVKGVGRHSDRHYCPRCGLKLKSCTCQVKGKG